MEGRLRRGKMACLKLDCISSELTSLFVAWETRRWKLSTFLRPVKEQDFQASNSALASRKSILLKWHHAFGRFVEAFPTLFACHTIVTPFSKIWALDIVPKSASVQVKRHHVQSLLAR